MKVLAPTLLAITMLGCGEEQRPAPRSTPGPVLHLVDDFEGKSVADFWAPGDYGSGRYEPGAVTITSDFARSGRSCLRITVKEGDIDQPGDPRVRTERAEMDSGKHELLGRTVSYRFSVRVESNFPIVDNRLVIAQWKQQGLRGSPVIAQRFREGRHYLTIRALGAFLRSRYNYDLPKLEPGRWHDMRYVIKFSTGNDGIVQVWMNGVKVVDFKGGTAEKDAGGRFYNKFGLYRDRWAEPMTIHFDDYELRTR